MQNYKKLSDLLDNEECKTYVNKLLHINPAQIALQYRDKTPCDASVLAYIVKLYQKAFSKLPLWVENHCLLTTQSYEQATSQTVALYKSTFLQGKKLLVLGGGLGVDEWALSKTFNHIISIDNDADLNKCVAYNNKCLHINNVERLTQTAENYLETTKQIFDCIYTDPDRREDGKREKTLQNSKPNIIALLPTLFKYSNSVVIKASPLIDIQKTIKELFAVKKVKVIAQNNEVKEILFFLEREFKGDTVLEASNYNNIERWQEFTSSGSEVYSGNAKSDLKYFYEPNVAVIKAGLSHNYAIEKGASLVDLGTAYCTSENFIDDFFGRSFKIVKEIEFNKKGTKKYLATASITKANISKRNFRLAVDELKKLLSIKDGGDDYLFFTQKNGKPIMFHCIKLK